MADLRAFITVDRPVLVYLRASRIMSKPLNHLLSWRQVAYEDLFSHPPGFSVRDFAIAWDKHIEKRWGLTFTRFRERMSQIALESLSHIEGVSIVHDLPTLISFVEKLGRCIVVPLDDDDLLGPDLGSRLSGLNLEPKTELVAWPNCVWYCRFGQRSQLSSSFKSQTLDGQPATVGSNSYGLTSRAFKAWSEKRLVTSLHKHWTIETNHVEVIQNRLSLEVKHTACSSQLFERIGQTYWWLDAVDTPVPWAEESCRKIQELHNQLLSDMGGTYRLNQIIERNLPCP